MHKVLQWICSFLMLVIISSCSDNNTHHANGISTDIVNNPKTVSTEIKNEDAFPQIEFEAENHNFGNITEGEKVEYSFKFKNTGAAGLVISSAKASCGCTVPIWPKEPISPGGEGIIKVSFNSEGRPGKVNKKVTVISNTNPNTKILTIEGQVLKAKDEANQ